MLVRGVFYHVTKAVQSLTGTYCHCLYDCSRIQELILYKFELDHYSTEVTEGICCVKGEGTVIRWFKKFYLDCKNLDDQVRSGRSKLMVSEATHQTIEASIKQAANGKYQASFTSYSSIWFITFMTSTKASESASYYQNIAKYLTHPG